MRKTKTRPSRRWAAGLQVALAALVMWFIGGEAAAQRVLVPEAAQGPTGVRVVEMVRVASRPVTPEEVESDYRLTVRHDGRAPMADVQVRLMAAGRGVAVISGTVPVARIVPGQTEWPRTAVRLRHARTHTVSASDLVWRTDGALLTAEAVVANRLAGAPAGRAVSVLPTVHGDGVPQAARAVRDGASGEAFFPRLLEAELAPDATVAQVNAALQSTGASILRSRPGDPGVTLVLDADLDLPALTAQAARLERTGAFAWAVPMLQAQPQALPDGVVPRDATGDRGAVRHHAAVRLPAAWGVADEASDNDVVLIVVDYFGKGNRGDYGLPVEGFGRDNDCGSDCEHGYHVLGIAAASFGSTADAFGKVTGATASAPRAIRVIDLASRGSMADVDFIRARLEAIVAELPDARFVVNLSLRFKTVRSDAGRYGRAWLRRVDSVRSPVDPAFDLRSRMLQVSAAGNFGLSSAAKLASPFNAAALMEATELSATPLSQALVVENRTTTRNESTSVVSPGCLSPTSSLGGHVGAIGMNVLSYIGAPPDAAVTTQLKSGTSMAAPQVAGLAVQLMALQPTQTLADLTQRIIDTARPVALPCTVAGAPVVDALAAALSLDTPDSKAVRGALLRRGTAPAAGFGVDDARTLATDLFAPRESLRPAYGTADLNGDGPVDGVGTPTRAPFDLDGRGDGASRYASAVSPVEPISPLLPGRPPLVWDERAVSDFDVFCYHLRSPLFEPGTPRVQRQARRNAALAPLLEASLRLGRVIDCGAIEVDAPYTVAITTTATTTATPISKLVPCAGGMCRSDLFCTPEAPVGTVERYRLNLKLDSSTRLARMDFGADGALQGEGFDALDLTAGTAGTVTLVDSGSEQIPRQPGWILDYFSDWEQRFDLRFNAATGELTGTVFSVTQTRWSAGPEVARCTATARVRMRPRP